MPSVPDDALGALVAAYARSSDPALARAAVAALPSLWRERSRALVLGMLEHPNEDVAIAALDALAELGVSDEHTPRRVANLLDRTQRMSMRIAAVRAITQARGDARPVSAALLEERLRRCAHLKTTSDAEIAVGLARGLLAIASNRAAAEQLLDETAKSWPAELRARVAPEA